jgi:hypothetical protein
MAVFTGNPPYEDGDARWATPGGLAPIVLPNLPAPERMVGPEITDHAREPKPAALDSGLQPKTDNLPDGAYEPIRLSALPG